jgi:hypothetical protein
MYLPLAIVAAAVIVGGSILGATKILAPEERAGYEIAAVGSGLYRLNKRTGRIVFCDVGDNSRAIRCSGDFF